MRTNAERSPHGDRLAATAPAHAAPAHGSDRIAQSGVEGVPRVHAAPDAVALQRVAGNRATVAALRGGAVVQRHGPTVQRAISMEQAERLARQLHDAMDGLGTDEEAIYGALSGRTADDMTEIRDAWLMLFDGSLDAALEDELTEGELARISQMMAPTASEAGLSEGERQAAAMDRAHVVAAQLRDAIEGLGTEEDQIFNALEGRAQEEIEEIKRQYLVLTGRTLETDLVDDMSGSELARALGLLGLRDAGTFTNSITQHMTEQATTVVRGRFNWTLGEDRLEVDVPARFVPAAGITVPFSTWQTQIDSIWNQFVVAEPGGQRVEIHMGLRDDPGDERVINVVQNAVPGSYGSPDRANAGKWYPVMPASTAPHEFGHLIGLPDEYQRTHGDFRQITGEDRTGPANTSGKTEAAIATELHDALFLDDAAQRAPRATTVLSNVGLIAGGVPQQGDFAQAVMAAYDEEYGGVFRSELLEALDEQLPDGSRWTLQTTFSYASGTIMGNPTVVGIQPHEHPVMARHLREFRDMVARQWPEKTWQVEPK